MHYLVLDTESSLDVTTACPRRVLVSIAYEVVSRQTGAVMYAVYDTVRVSSDARFDAASVRIHGISHAHASSHGQPLSVVLGRLTHTLERFRPIAIVGHDIVNDMALLVSEALRVRKCVPQLGPYATRLICTKLATVALCRIPLASTVQKKHAPPLPDVLCGSSSVEETDDDAHWKWPNLNEAYDRVVTRMMHDDGSSPVRAATALAHHDARDDVARCRDIFVRLVAPNHGETDDSDP